MHRRLLERPIWVWKELAVVNDRVAERNIPTFRAPQGQARRGSNCSPMFGMNAAHSADNPVPPSRGRKCRILRLLSKQRHGFGQRSSVFIEVHRRAGHQQLATVAPGQFALYIEVRQAVAALVPAIRRCPSGSSQAASTAASASLLKRWKGSRPA